jgi:hypothetical protein
MHDTNKLNSILNVKLDKNTSYDAHRNRVQILDILIQKMNTEREGDRAINQDFRNFQQKIKQVGVRCVCYSMN